ncbi:plasmid replication DNA-binding protein [Psychrobacter faecalis]
MKISVTKAAKEWGVSRTTIYQKVSDGELSRSSDKKIDTSEMIRVFGEPAAKKRTEQPLSNSNNTPLSSQKLPDCTALEHQLALEKLKNEHLQQQVHDQKQLIENYQEQISQLNKTLEKANASIHDFAQVRLLEFKQAEISYEPPLEQEKEKTNDSTVALAQKKKRWWAF